MTRDIERGGFGPYLREACLIGGAWRAAESGRTISVQNPAEVIGTVPLCGRAETAAAIEAASAALPDWRERTAAPASASKAEPSAGLELR